MLIMFLWWVLESRTCTMEPKTNQNKNKTLMSEMALLEHDHHQLPQLLLLFAVWLPLIIIMVIKITYKPEKLEKLNRLEISGRSAQTGVNWCIGSTLLS